LRGCGDWTASASFLVGHSFGGAVVLDAAAQAPDVIAVAALSSQTAGVGDIAALSPRPLLFVHGEADEILPVGCSRQLFARADQPKQLRLYPGAGMVWTSAASSSTLTCGSGSLMLLPGD
jgi:pimeloyl-ACP methyl ester carboxylesterase